MSAAVWLERQIARCSCAGGLDTSKLAVGRRPELLALAGDDEEWRARPVEESTFELFLT